MRYGKHLLGVLLHFNDDRGITGGLSFLHRRPSTITTHTPPEKHWRSHGGVTRSRSCTLGNSGGGILTEDTCQNEESVLTKKLLN